jgi:hypothetical protein
VLLYAASALVLCAAPAARAQDMNIALSRLSMPCPGGTGLCTDNPAYTRVMTEFAGAMMPPVLTTAGTRGVRGIYIGFETSINGISNDQPWWHRAVEGDGGGEVTTSSRFVDSVLAWTRFNIRKGLPFGFELAANISYLPNTIYWAPGVEIKWSLFEGFRYDAGWIPDIAVRAAVQTLVGDGEFNVTVPTIDVILAEPFVVANTVELIPFIYGQVGFVFVDSELVDLSPATTAFTPCDPDPRTPDVTSGAPPYCRGDGSQLNDNVVFPSLRNERYRLGAGLQIRYEWFTLLGSFAFDVIPPNEADGELMAPDLGRQWHANVGVGVTL